MLWSLSSVICPQHFTIPGCKTVQITNKLHIELELRCCLALLNFLFLLLFTFLEPTDKKMRSLSRKAECCISFPISLFFRERGQWTDTAISQYLTKVRYSNMTATVSHAVQFSSKSLEYQAGYLGLAPCPFFLYIIFALKYCTKIYSYHKKWAWLFQA